MAAHHGAARLGERALTVTGFVARCGVFAGHDITARRLQSQNAFSYVHNSRARGKEPA